MKQFYILLLALVPFVSSGQELLKDINTSNASSHPRAMVEANGKQFFVAKGFHNNNEIWVSDGTTAGTQVVVGRNTPTTLDVYNVVLNSLNDQILFVAENLNPEFKGKEVWISDGTSAGTRLLKDIYSGPNGSSARDFFRFSNKMVFFANNGTNGQEPWITDGTTEGTFMLKNINTGAGESYIVNKPIIANNKLFFTVSAAGIRTELWVTDGTTAGTFKLKDVTSTINYMKFMVAVGNKCFFIGSDDMNGAEVWVSDGTEAGTKIVKDISPGASSSSIGDFIEYNNKLLFVAGTQFSNSEIWLSDGTNSGTQMVKNTDFQSPLKPFDLIKIGNIVFFIGTDGIHGRELWKTDGTSTGTVMVKDINQASINDQSFTFAGDYNRRKFFNVNGQLFFFANSGTEGYELWKSDGTSAGTRLVKDFVPGSESASYDNFIVLGSNFYFSATDNMGQADYWKSDGTLGGTVRFSSLNSNISFRNVYPLAVSLSNHLYFAAFGDTTGYELYKTDGNTVSFLKDIETTPHYTYDNFTYRVSLNNDVLFLLNDNEHGLELWKTDGFNNTKLLKDSSPYPSLNIPSQGYYSGSSFYSPTVSLNGYGYFSSINSIWRTDGENISLIQEYGSFVSRPSVSGNKIRWFSEDKLYESDGSNVSLITTLPDFTGNTQSGDITLDINGITYFNYRTKTYGEELWRTDGTAEGTFMLKDISPGSDGTPFNYDFRKVGNKFFFTNYIDGELWVSDGTESGTQMVKDINPGGNGSYPSFMTNYNDNLLIFVAYDSVNGAELWKSDGTYDGTVMISDINSGSAGSQPSNLTAESLTVFNNKVYFGATSDVGKGLYETDGNSVTLIKGDFDAQSMIKFNNEILISGKSNNLNVGYELWKSDGTNEGTILLKDINLGSGSSSPKKFFANKDKLFFMANDGIHGEEIWIIKPCPDNLSITSTIADKSTYQASNGIVAETSNKITSTAKITYDAGKYVLLKPGFSTSHGAVFQSKIGGCISQSGGTNGSIKD